LDQLVRDHEYPSSGQSALPLLPLVLSGLLVHAVLRGQRRHHLGSKGRHTRRIPEHFKHDII
jgi:hypothetical protein